MSPEEFHRLVEYYTGLSDAELQHAFDHGRTGYQESIVWELVSGVYHQRRTMARCQSIGQFA